MTENVLIDTRCYMQHKFAAAYARFGLDTDKQGFQLEMRKYLTVESRPIIATGTPITTGTEDIVK